MTLFWRRWLLLLVTSGPLRSEFRVADVDADRLVHTSHAPPSRVGVGVGCGVVEVADLGGVGGASVGEAGEEFGLGFHGGGDGVVGDLLAGLEAAKGEGATSAVGLEGGADAEGREGGRGRGADGRGADDEEVGGRDVVRERAVAPAEAGGGATDVERVHLGVRAAERVVDVGGGGERDDGLAGDGEGRGLDAHGGRARRRGDRRRAHRAEAVGRRGVVGRRGGGRLCSLNTRRLLWPSLYLVGYVGYEIMLNIKLRPRIR